jgi:predicted HicB family RNase H-like nuclease
MPKLDCFLDTGHPIRHITPRQENPFVISRAIRTVVAKAVKDMRANGEEIPEALASRRSSGKFMVRVPPEIHRQLAVEAAEAGVSLNRLVSAKLS